MPRGSTQSERYRLRGRVQGVGFRWATQRRAQELGIVGWVRNCPDGSVEVFAQGEGDALELLAGFLRRGSAPARVDAMERDAAAIDATLRGFEIR